MIPAIGFIVGAYVITRMLQILVKQNPKEHPAVVVSAAVTIIVTLLALVSLVMGAEEVRKALPPELR